MAAATLAGNVEIGGNRRGGDSTVRYHNLRETGEADERSLGPVLLSRAGQAGHRDGHASGPAARRRQTLKRRWRQLSQDGHACKGFEPLTPVHRQKTPIT